MIVCHTHRFIFINTRDTAGTEIELALSRFCGSGDTITALDPVAERMRRQLGQPGPQNDVLPVAMYRPRDWLRLPGLGGRARLASHTPAVMVQSMVGDDIWQRYFKFCVERDPWERAVARYFACAGGAGNPSLAAFLAAQKAELSNFPLYSIDERLAVDRVIRFEHLSAELDALHHLLDLPHAIELPASIRTSNAEMPHYAELLGQAEKALIDAVCQREIETFGYGFRTEAPSPR